VRDQVKHHPHPDRQRQQADESEWKTHPSES
jgi:hypothetical protein